MVSRPLMARPRAVRSHLVAVVLASSALAVALPQASFASWPATGAQVSSFAVSDHNPVVVSDGQQGVIVAWSSSRSSTGLDIYVQRVGPAGDTLWSGAVAVCNATGDQDAIAMVSDGVGGAIVAWQDLRGANLDVYAQHVLSSGAVDATGSWAANGVAVASGTGDQGAPALVSDGNNGAIVVWEDHRGSNWDIYAQHLLANGDLDNTWTATGAALCTATGDQRAPHAVRDGSNGAIACWDDARPGGPAVFAQQVTSAGVAAWTAQGVDVGNATTAQGPVIAEDGTGGAYVAWGDPTANGTSPRVLAQRLSPAGARLWNSLSPVPVSNLSGATPRALVPGGADSVDVVYASASDMRVRLVSASQTRWTSFLSLSATGPFNGVAAARLNPGLVFVSWEHGSRVLGQPYSDAPATVGSPVNAAGSTVSVQLHPALALASSGYPFVVWDDDRNAVAQAEDLFAQDFSPTGVPGTFHTVTATPGANGSFVPTGAQYVADGGSVEFIARSNGGYHIAGMTVNGGPDLGPIPNHKFTNVLADSSIAATFSNAAVAMSFATTASTYRAIGIPLEFPNDSTSQVLLPLGAPDRQVWRFGRWNAADSAYHEVAGDLDSLRIGDGYWFITRDGVTLSVSGQPAPEVNRGIRLSNKTSGFAGFNQIANPFRFPVADSALRVWTGPATSVPYAGNGVVTEKIQYWDEVAKQYTTTHTLLPGVAYWFEKLSGANVSIEFPFRTSQGVPGPVPALPPGADWAIEITASRPGLAPGRLVVGTAAVAHDAWNGFCGKRLPRPPMPACDVYVTHPSWGSASGDYVEDFAAPEPVLAWDVNVGADGPLGQGTLAFHFEGVPAQAHARLVDAAHGWARDVSDGERVEVALGSTPRTLRLEVSTDPGAALDAPAAHAVFRCAAPVPFSDRTALVFSLAQRSEFALDVYDISGRRVHAVALGAIPAGEHVEAWDGRADDGRRVPPGVYLARWRAAGKSGTARLVRVP
jgi:hypothetical protein